MLLPVRCACVASRQLLRAAAHQDRTEHQCDAGNHGWVSEVAQPDVQVKGAEQKLLCLLVAAHEEWGQETADAEGAEGGSLPVQDQ